MKKETRIRILETCCILETPKGSHYHMTREQLLAIFFPFKERYFKLISGDSPDADWCVFSTRLGDHHLLRKDEINIFLCIENLGHWPWYPHYNRYGGFWRPKGPCVSLQSHRFDRRRPRPAIYRDPGCAFPDPLLLVD